MSSEMLLNILLSIVGSVGLIIATQLIRIANTVKKIDTHLQVLANDHLNLKNEVSEVKSDLKKNTENTANISNRVLVLEHYKNGKQ